MLIWDTGEYTILPYHSDQEKKQTDDELSTSSSDETHQPSISESSKLHRAFKTVRLNYTTLSSHA